MSEEFYTASQAIQVLGLSRPVFFRKVNEGRIPKVIPPGKRQGLYPKRSIDALAQAMHILFESGEHIVFSRSSILEQQAEMEIGIKAFGSEFITPLPERIAFQLKSEYTFWSLKVDGQVQGYISMFRFPAQFLDNLLTGKQIEREITVREVLPFTRGEPFPVYIDVLAMNPELPRFERVLYAGILITRFADVILDLLANQYEIEKLYTVTASKEGDSLVRKAGFRLMPGKSLTTGRVAYEFDLDESGIARLKEFSRRGLD